MRGESGRIMEKQREVEVTIEKRTLAMSRDAEKQNDDIKRVRVVIVACYSKYCASKYIRQMRLVLTSHVL